MANKRFIWKKATEYEAIKELKRRGIQRMLMPSEIEKMLHCRVESCNEILREEDIVFASTKNPGTSDGAAAHADCTKLFLSAVAKETKAAQWKREEQRGILKVPDQLDAQEQLKTGADGNLLYYQGWYSGVHFTVEGKVAASLKTEDSEWFRGFYDGAAFASEHNIVRK
jgi:hypothetical protein